MRFPRLALVAVVLAPLGGCKWLDDMRARERDRDRPTGAIKPTTPEFLVGHLNARSEKLQTLTYSEARLTARQGLLSYTLRGELDARQPQDFRLRGAGGLAGGKVDLGSNREQFWVYVEVPTQQPVFVFASHSDFQNGQAQLPGNVPFEPEWVMQGLGMTRLPEPNAPGSPPYKVDVNERERTYTLSWPATTPAGVTVRREVVFNADDARDGRPQVKQYVVRDPKTNKALYAADVKAARTVALGPPDAQGKQATVQYPTHIVLRSDDQKFELDLTLDGAQVNQPFAEERARRLFTRPSIPGSNPINLAEARFALPGK